MKKMKNYEDILEMWKTHEPFVNEDDIPDIPVVSKEDYINIIIPNIIRCGGIPKSKLVIGKTYVGSCRNASEAIWNGKTFTYKRYKFGSTFFEDINHFEDDDGNFILVRLSVSKLLERL